MDPDEYSRMAVAAEHHWWYKATRTLLDELLGPLLPTPTETTRYLDAAGGTGATGRWLAERAPTVIADVEPFALATASKISRGYRAELADINQLPHPDGSFDAVLCVTALYHQLNRDSAATVTELVRVTRPGGVVCLMEPGIRRLRRGHDEVTHAARRFSRNDLAALARGAGLHVIRSTGAYAFLVAPAAVSAVVDRHRPTSDIDKHASGLGGTLPVLARAERRALRRWSLPAGLSVLAIGRKPG